MVRGAMEIPFMVASAARSRADIFCVRREIRAHRAVYSVGVSPTFVVPKAIGLIRVPFADVYGQRFLTIISSVVRSPMPPADFGPSIADCQSGEAAGPVTESFQRVSENGEPPIVKRVSYPPIGAIFLQAIERP